MQITCPHCGTPVTAENINIQRMAAVCPACHSVFQFDPSPSHIKRRKIKQPQHITVAESDGRVRLAFRTTFGQNMDFLATTGFGLAFTFISVLMLVAGAKPATVLLAGGFTLISLVLYYWSALIAYNKTHIEVNDEEIRVSRRPLPNLLSQPNTINLAGIRQIRYEETPVSKRESYDTPRYNVWAEVEDGKPKLVVGDLIEDYAVFITQRLNDLLDTEPDVSRLVDEEAASENGSADAFIAQSKA